MTNNTQTAELYAAVKNVIANACDNAFYALIDSRSVEKALADAMTFAVTNGWKTLRLGFEEDSTEARTLGNIRDRIDREDFFNLVDEDGNKVDWPTLSFKPAEPNYAAEAAKTGTSVACVKASYGIKEDAPKAKAKKPKAVPAAEPVGPAKEWGKKPNGEQGMNLGAIIAEKEAKERKMADA